MFAILALLGVLCIFLGFILFVVGGFRVSVLWGLIVLFLPSVLSFLAGLAGSAMGLMDTSWFLGVITLLSLLPWLVFMGLHWDKAKNGFLLYLAGLVFLAASVVSIDPDTKKKIATYAVASATQSGQPLPQAISDWLEIKKPAAPEKPGTPGTPGTAGAPGATGVSDSPAGKPVAAPAAGSAPVAAAAAGLENEAQVTAAVAELHDRAAKLKTRKDLLKGSPDQLAVTALAEDIKQFNDRLKVVTQRQVELKMIPPPAPTPTPGPVIPATVVIPPSTPAPAPVAPKKK
jgi:hypothetical protein